MSGEYLCAPAAEAAAVSECDDVTERGECCCGGDSKRCATALIRDGAAAAEAV